MQVVTCMFIIMRACFSALTDCNSSIVQGITSIMSAEESTEQQTAIAEVAEDQQSEDVSNSIKKNVVVCKT